MHQLQHELINTIIIVYIIILCIILIYYEQLRCPNAEIPNGRGPNQKKIEIKKRNYTSHRTHSRVKNK